MDSKNVILAIVLSSIVLIGWGTFFAPPVPTEIAENKIEKKLDDSSPTIENEKVTNEVTRNEAINKTNRIKIENNNIKGSMSLEGAIIDDIIFKNYRQSLNSENKVIFLNPKNSKNLKK